MTFVYGSDEMPYACAPYFEAAIKKDGVTCKRIVGRDRENFYSLFLICRAAKES